MRKFITGIAVGMLSMVIVYVGIDAVGAESNVDYAPLTEQQSKDMQLAWYQYHHDDLIKGLSGKCE